MYWDFSELNWLLAAFSIFINTFGLIVFFLKAWGLYMINTKLWEEHAWLSWVPVVNIYMWSKAANKSFVSYVVYPILAIFIGGILVMFTFWISLLIAIIYFIWAWIQICSGISKRTWRWGWTTAWLFLIPGIMLPVIGYKLSAWNTIKESKTEEKIEL